MDKSFAERAAGILHNLALENRRRWWSPFRRWFIHDEPLRNDAANLLRQYKVGLPMPEGTFYVGDRDERQNVRTGGATRAWWNDGGIGP